MARLSLLYALLEGSREICEAHLKAALAVWDYSEASVKYVFGTVDNINHQKVLNKLEQKGPLTSDEIRTQVFSKNKSAADVAELLSALEQSRQIRRCQKEFKTSEAWEYVGVSVE